MIIYVTATVEDSDHFDEVEIDFKLWKRLNWSAINETLTEQIHWITLWKDRKNHLPQGHSKLSWHILAHLGSNEAIFGGDFPENYSFIIQD